MRGDATNAATPAAWIATDALDLWTQPVATL